MATLQQPSIMAQFGFEKDPNAYEHIKTPAGHKLTRTLTAGGHAVDSSQPGFPIYHRRIGNPYPMFAVGIGASLIILGFGLIEIRGITNPTVFYAIALPLGGLGVLTSAMFAFAEGSTFLATIAGTFAGLFGAVSLAFLPWTGIQAAYVGSVPNPQLGVLAFYKGLSIAFFVAMVPVFLTFLASFKTSFPIANGALLIVLGLILAGIAFKDFPKAAIQKTSGAIFVIVGIVLFYHATAVMLKEEGIHALPAFILPRTD
ncbi:hypothetical protein IE53DRAFT_250873 [Violaceomyces palustris]|uniref:Uncharacterized protein n=1 Tax=Violaceomyces palustris TaxID=1673888 RepID=A0ACD0NNT7_9BASI|nr:hypothetical protein IE53DRAFT_250873 [Violaceomyces palustris]